MAFSTNYYQRYHNEQNQTLIPLSIFDRGLITNTASRNIFGINTEITHFFGGSFIARFTILGKSFELWHIKDKTITFPKIPKEQLRHPINIELFQHQYNEQPSTWRWIKWKWCLLLHKIHQMVLPPKTQFSTIYEMFGDHDIENLLYITPKNILFVRSRYLIKLAMDLKLLNQRDIAKSKQEEIGRSINSFDMLMVDNDNISTLTDLADFNVVAHDTEEDLERAENRNTPDETPIITKIEQIEKH